VPFLRFKKPTSPFLSRIIKDKSVQRQSRLDLLDRLEILGLWADDEEAWDVMTSEDNAKCVSGDVGWDLRIGEGKDLRGGWGREIVKARRRVERDLKLQKKAWLETGRKMAEIVEMENSMAETERIERKKKMESRRMA